jgi:hypothetical protein
MTDSYAPGDSLNTPLIAVIGFASAILTFALILGVQVMYYHAEASETERKVLNVKNEDADHELNKQDTKLAHYAWLDRRQGRVALKIERAMELVVQECQKPPAGS